MDIWMDGDRRTYRAPLRGSRVKVASLTEVDKILASALTNAVPTMPLSGMKP